MLLIKTEDAAGQALCHDITQIIPGAYKGARFRKGHIVTPEDIPVLLSMGKEHLYIWGKKAGELHEEEAAELLCRLVQGTNIEKSGTREGRINLFAACNGLLKIKTETLIAINSIDGIIIATRRGNQRANKGSAVAALRVVPLIIEESVLKKAEAICEEHGGGKILEIIPFKHKRVGLIITGSEVFYGRIEDKFSPVVEEKLAEYPAKIVERAVLDDNHERIAEKCREMLAKKCDMVICTGGMSVDPDDKTPLAIKNVGADIVSYGAPVLPGGMILLAYQEEAPIIGLPACVMYSKQTIFDLILPRLFADDRISKSELSALGEGGLL